MRKYLINLWSLCVSPALQGLPKWVDYILNKGFNSLTLKAGNSVNLLCSKMVKFHAKASYTIENFRDYFWLHGRG